MESLIIRVENPGATPVTWKVAPSDATVHTPGSVRDGFSDVTVYGGTPPVIAMSIDLPVVTEGAAGIAVKGDTVTLLIVNETCVVLFAESLISNTEEPTPTPLTWKVPPLDAMFHDVGFVRDGLRDITAYGGTPPVIAMSIDCPFVTDGKPGITAKG